MSSPDLSAHFPALPSRAPLFFEPIAVRPRHRFWLHGLLFLATLLTTTAVGARMQFNFDHDLPFFDINRDLSVFWQLWSHPAVLVQGLPFSLTLLSILLAHEFGHYIACVYYGIDASLPYFLPAPTFTGTLGAFIRIRSAIYSKKALFDIGIAGPIAGFIFLLPALSTGLALSKIVPNIALTGSVQFGSPILLRFFEALILPGAPVSDVYLHPVARAGWVALFATALNLLPAGQLDGGHIVYALFGERHRVITRLFLAALIPMGIFFWQGWLVWAVLLFFFGRKHPAIYDDQELGGTRVRLALLGFTILLLCFTVAPVVS